MLVVTPERPLTLGRWWFRLFGHGVRLVDHRSHPPLFTERQRVDGRPYLHVGPWCFHPIRPWRTAA